MKNPSFEALEIKDGVLLDLSGDELPVRIIGLNELAFRVPFRSTAFVFVQKGFAWTQSFMLSEGMYACIRHGETITPMVGSSVLVIESIGYDGMFQVGGPIEKVGRLKYIDGCTDSLLIPPVKKGDPCFNHLHFPKGINQTMHTHPSIRAGLVVRGRGNCVTPWGDIPLVPGSAFIIYPEPILSVTRDGKTTFNETTHPDKNGRLYLIGSHCFQTFDEEMDVIAFHPDSDFGPTDEVHPMINRTIVNGISASNLPDIQTK